MNYVEGSVASRKKPGGAAVPVTAAGSSTLTALFIHPISFTF